MSDSSYFSQFPIVPFEFYPPTVLKSQTVHLSLLGSVTVLLYDILITFDQEIAYIWNSKWSSAKSSWSLPKLLYIVVRYGSLMIQLLNITLATKYDLTHKICSIWAHTTSGVEHLILIAMEIIMVMRVSALYQNNRNVITIMITALGLQVSFTSFLLYQSFGWKNWFSPRSSGLYETWIPVSGCLVFGFERYIPVLYWLSALTFESLLFFLTLINIVQHYRKNVEPSRLLMIFFRDGSAWYAAVFTIMSFNSILLATELFKSYPVPWIYTIISVAGSRLMLSLRAESILLKNESTGIELETFRARSASGVDSASRTVCEEEARHENNDDVLDISSERRIVHNTGGYRVNWLSDWRTIHDLPTTEPSIHTTDV